MLTSAFYGESGKMDAPKEEQHLEGAKMYVRKDGSVVGNLGNQDLTQLVLSEIEGCFGTECYYYKTITDGNDGLFYKVLFEDMLFL